MPTSEYRWRYVLILYLYASNLALLQLIPLFFPDLSESWYYIASLRSALLQTSTCQYVSITWHAFQKLAPSLSLSSYIDVYMKHVMHKIGMITGKC